ncbi:OB-fold nucleic acid binding domain-containing protein [Amycolatopsis sp. DG1A-15b]|uniref:OB-fold nucleic acid binding domain-containing protein n=2 Tax=unclassified Amycolatopsis TaxID=2618356 RepID=UPI00255BAD28|nr:OB-fold nucleic acid binding domain-containing protein [Amycolatopsis sp. DG1A-15b]WIX89356.1 OB-fold nucleic acid binding domain-containing protein [Amycolatopsis sp. DG1A-15b]
MPAKDGGYFSRLVRKLTSDVEELDADEMSMRSGAEGAQRACDCRSGEEVTVMGRLRSVELCPTNEAATLEAELFDGTQGVTLIWLGRRRIPGIEPGRTIKVRGRMAERNGQKVLYNPYYELQSPVS